MLLDLDARAPCHGHLQRDQAGKPACAIEILQDAGLVVGTSTPANSGADCDVPLMPSIVMSGSDRCVLCVIPATPFCQDGRV